MGLKAQKNVFGQSLRVKRKVMQGVGRATRKRLLNHDRLRVDGAEMLHNLPDSKVLFIANHQTVFTDVIAMFHTFQATLRGKNYMKDPKLNLYFVAARETMERGLLPKLFALGGAVTVERTWRSGEESVDRAVNPDDTRSIGLAIDDGWVVTFPQGTTRPGAPVRKGTAHIIKQYRPTVVPVRVDGFNRAFDKSGLRQLDPTAPLSLRFDEPLHLDYDQPVDAIVDQVGAAIGL